MPRNGSGNYSLPQPPFVAGTTISSAAVNSDFSDIAAALTGSLPRDGQAGMTGQLKTVDGSFAAPSISFNNELTSGFFRAGTGEVGVTIQGVEVGLFTSGGWSGSVLGSAPVGSIIDFAGATAPSLWYLCYGQAVSRTTYAALFVVIGTTYGSGDGVTTFNLPDLRGNVTAGADNMGGVAAGRLTSTYFGTDPTVLGDQGGSQSKTLITANLPSYTPTGTITNGAITTTITNSVNAGDAIVGTSANSFASSGSSAPFYTGGVQPKAIAASTQATSTFAGSAQGGSSTALSVIQPALIVNKIIYAGV